MKKLFELIFLMCLVALTGCATRQEVLVAKASHSGPISTVAIAKAEGNSTEMTSHVEHALIKEGLSLKSELPMDTRVAADVDAIVSYVDVWRWDIVMYLQKLHVKVFDAKTGDLLVTGQWSDSPLHGFRNAKLTTQELIAEVFEKLRTQKK